MEIFEFVKKVLFVGLAILSGYSTQIQWTIKNVKQDHKLLMLMDMSLCFSHLVLKQVNVLVVVIILTIHMQTVVFLMLVKNLYVKYLI